jgi:hypothetical protein
MEVTANFCHTSCENDATRDAGAQRLARLHDAGESLRAAASGRAMLRDLGTRGVSLPIQR